MATSKIKSSFRELTLLGNCSFTKEDKSKAFSVQNYNKYKMVLINIRTQGVSRGSRIFPRSESAEYTYLATFIFQGESYIIGVKLGENNEVFVETPVPVDVSVYVYGVG